MSQRPCKKAENKKRFCQVLLLQLLPEDRSQLWGGLSLYNHDSCEGDFGRNKADIIRERIEARGLHQKAPWQSPHSSSRTHREPGKGAPVAAAAKVGGRGGARRGTLFSLRKSVVLEGVGLSRGQESRQKDNMRSERRYSAKDGQHPRTRRARE